MPTKQETFDTVVNHLRQQGVQCRDEDDDCVYRGPNGLKCAVGAVIPDDRYDPMYEGAAVCVDDLGPGDGQHKTTCGARALRALLIDLGHDLLLLSELQDTHDDPVDAWEIDFEDIAEEHGLKYTPPKV